MWSKLGVPEKGCSDGIVLLDEHWRCVAVNASAARLLEIDAAEAVDKPVWDVLANVLDESTREQWRLICLERLPANFGDFGGAGLHVTCRCWPARNGAVLSFIDATDVRETLEAAADERKRVESFLAVLAHELRNPLTTLCHGLAILRGAKREIDVQIVLDSMERQLRYFVRVVDDLLDVSRIVRGRIHLRKERLRVHEVVSDALAAIDSMAAAKGVPVEADVSGEPAVQADAIRLQQVLINLLKNAVAATERGGHVFVSARESGAAVEILVRDTGRGIESHRLSHLFEPAYESDVDDHAGLGVGLGVVKRLVELHGGNIAAHSDGVGRGATFAVRLPSA